MDIAVADFNGDGIADFVVAPNSNEPIYVNLGNGDGTFTKSTFNTMATILSTALLRLILTMTRWRIL